MIFGQAHSWSTGGIEYRDQYFDIAQRFRDQCGTVFGLPFGSCCDNRVPGASLIIVVWSADKNEPPGTISDHFG